MAFEAFELKYKDMTKEEALAYHRMMWGDMAETLGDNPTARQREDFKADWVREHFDKPFIHNCVLCEFVKKHPLSNTKCRKCPIDWTPIEDPEKIGARPGRCYNNYKNGGTEGAIYLDAPISEILALPEREV